MAASRIAASGMAASRISASGMALTLNKSKTCKSPLGETGCLGNLYSTCWLLLIHSYSLLTQSVRLPMVTYPHCAALVWFTGRHAAPEVILDNFYLTCWLPKHQVLLTVQPLRDLRKAMPQQSSPDASHPSFIPWMLRIWESVFYPQEFFTLHTLYLGKQRISPGVAIILSMCFCPRT